MRERGLVGRGGLLAGVGLAVVVAVVVAVLVGVLAPRITVVVIARKTINTRHHLADIERLPHHFADDHDAAADLEDGRGEADSVDGAEIDLCKSQNKNEKESK